MTLLSGPWVLSLLLGLYPIYLLSTTILSHLAILRAGCSTPIKYKHYDPILGLDLLKKKLKAMESGDSRSIDRLIFAIYGKTVLTKLFTKNFYLTMDSANIQTILATEVDKFGNEPMNRDACAPFLGDGIMAVDGVLWKRSRQVINPIFARAQVSELSSFDGHVQKMMRRIPRDGSTVDLQPLFKMLFLDSSTEFIFGRSADSLSPETSSVIARRLPAVFDEALIQMRSRFMLSKYMRKLLRLLGRDKAYLKTCAEVHSIIDTLIEEEIQKQKVDGIEENGNPYNYVLLKELIKITDDKLYIRNELLNIFLG